MLGWNDNLQAGPSMPHGLRGGGVEQWKAQHLPSCQIKSENTSVQREGTPQSDQWSRAGRVCVGWTCIIYAQFRRKTNGEEENRFSVYFSLTYTNTQLSPSVHQSWDSSVYWPAQQTPSGAVPAFSSFQHPEDVWVLSAETGWVIIKSWINCTPAFDYSRLWQ